jgi:hypothetical protein
MGGRSSICCVGARSVRREQPTHQKLGRAPGSCYVSRNSWLGLSRPVGGCTIMMGTKIHSFAPLPRDISLEELVPKDHFYRRLEARLDLSFVRELVRPLYANGGRPSVDPVVFFLNVSRECLLSGCSS